MRLSRDRTGSSLALPSAADGLWELAGLVWRRQGDDTVAAIILGTIERSVGALEHVAQRLALVLKSRQSDRHRDLDAPVALMHRERLVGDRAPQPLGHHAGDMQ